MVAHQHFQSARPLGMRQRYPTARRWRARPRDRRRGSAHRRTLAAQRYYLSFSPIFWYPLFDEEIGIAQTHNLIPHINWCHPVSTCAKFLRFLSGGPPSFGTVQSSLFLTVFKTCRKCRNSVVFGPCSNVAPSTLRLAGRKPDGVEACVTPHPWKRGVRVIGWVRLVREVRLG